MLKWTESCRQSRFAKLRWDPELTYILHEGRWDRAWQRAFDNVLDGVDEEIIDGVRRAALGHLKAAEEFGNEDEIEPLYDLMALDPEWYGRVIE